MAKNKRSNKMPTVISTFAGCGGSSLGYKLAGFKELLAIDFDDHAEKIFNLNFPKVPFWNRDIKTVEAKEILEFCKINIGELDVLDGSPPCQGFSTAGKRKIKDSRNDLFKEFVRLIEGLQPKVFVMENVSGMVKGKMKGMFKEIILSLKSIGYNVKCKRLNAANYGVPQSRERLFFIGIRNDLNKEPVFPIKIDGIVTVEIALKGVSNEDEEIKCLEGPRAKLIGSLRQGEQMNKYVPNKYFNTLRLHPKKVSPTIPKLFGSKWGSFFAHWNEDRSITIAELKRICSFPDDFQLVGTFEQKWARLGNAVMPLQMKAIGEAIKPLVT